MKLLHRALVFLSAVFCLLPSGFAAGKLVSGPMLGYQAKREVFLWLETKDAQKVTLDYWLSGQPGTKRTLEQAAPTPTPAGGQIIHFRPGLLEMGARYEYSLRIDGVKQTFPFPTTFQTQALWEWRGPPPDFKFIVGSCAYINDPAYDRPVPFGKTTRTFELMGDSGADFMVWLGDNWYYREPDYDSLSGLWYRPQHDRAIPEMRKLLASMHHYATWDDHDYGPNDSNWSYEYKQETLKIFQAYWGNHSYGEPNNPGVYTKFYWSDAAFFLMDNHYHRDDATLNLDTHPKKTQWGRRQLEWLKQSLLQAKELKHFTFMFIATGGQVITDLGGASETFAHYPAEREELLKFIAQHNITGVIFLSGDVHFTELARKKITDTQWVYELTSSPLSAGVSKVNITEHANDPQRIEGTFVPDQNFSVVSITGLKEDRSVVFTCIDQQGVTRFTKTIKAAELK